jgi:hypothetical protein
VSAIHKRGCVDENGLWSSILNGDMLTEAAWPPHEARPQGVSNRFSSHEEVCRLPWSKHVPFEQLTNLEELWRFDSFKSLNWWRRERSKLGRIIWFVCGTVRTRWRFVAEKSFIKEQFGPRPNPVLQQSKERVEKGEKRIKLSLNEAAVIPLKDNIKYFYIYFVELLWWCKIIFE